MPELEIRSIQLFDLNDEPLFYLRPGPYIVGDSSDTISRDLINPITDAIQRGRPANTKSFAALGETGYGQTLVWRAPGADAFSFVNSHPGSRGVYTPFPIDSQKLSIVCAGLAGCIGMSFASTEICIGALYLEHTTTVGVDNAGDCYDSNGLVRVTGWVGDQEAQRAESWNAEAARPYARAQLPAGVLSSAGPDDELIVTLPPGEYVVGDPMRLGNAWARQTLKAASADVASSSERPLATDGRSAFVAAGRLGQCGRFGFYATLPRAHSPAAGVLLEGWLGFIDTRLLERTLTAQEAQSCGLVEFLDPVTIWLDPSGNIHGLYLPIGVEVVSAFDPGDEEEDEDDEGGSDYGGHLPVGSSR